MQNYDKSKFLKILVTLVLLRGCGCIIHNIARKYKDINVSDLRKLEKLHIERNKSQLDIIFSISCKTFGVFPKFIYVNIRNIDEYDTLCLKKKLRKNAMTRKLEILKQLSVQNLTQLIGLLSKNYFFVT